MKEKMKVCGIDVHKEFLQVCILSRSGEKSFHRFRHTHDGILALKDLVAPLPTHHSESLCNLTSRKLSMQ